MLKLAQNDFLMEEPLNEPLQDDNASARFGDECFAG
jgi:hypothetical protein